jgi:rod shape-determining protein MreC
MLERSQKDVWRFSPWLTAFLLLGNFLLMAYDAKTQSQERVLRVGIQAAANFIQSPVTAVTSGISGYFESLTSLRSAQTENEQLRERVQQLDFQVQSQIGLTEENARLRGLLALKDQSPLKLVPAQVVGRDPSAWFDTVILNRGSLDGVKLNNPVVSNGALVGRVTAVSPLTSQVTLITKNKSGLGGVIGELGGSSAIGVVAGSGRRDMLQMGYVPGSVAVTVGEFVFTTGQDGIFPAGLKIGTVAEVETGSTGEPHVISVEPSAKLFSIQEVAVVLYEAPRQPDFEKSVPNATGEGKADRK